MKQLKSITNRIALVIATFYLSLVSFAQDDTKKIDVDINTKGADSGNFFMQPWVWVVGGLIFILLLVALMRGGGSRSE